MTYTIKEVSEKVNLSIYTLRFYDKQGLLPFVARNQSGYREFTDGDLNLIHTICCLKDTGMKLDDIRQYIKYVMGGPATIEQRKALLKKHRHEVELQQQKIADNLKEIDYKLDVYENPQAKEIVAQELQFVTNEKIANNLPNPYHVVAQ
ncbi:MerR family transcriptional regulator [Paucilactobacillus suebicus]|uniref:Transcriptional regulator n=1 Tax=Paucilactobacillus suebicus DSM 5007 = KCTC 3549 TaxID=1423807 RepID=A0A0R1VY11_9LACO|nr:MerR family transcriptional regulator [Paucilactobacillus suebicus]KRM10558.1 transcriptional regulator [Paucilactobacillus suebicus DSM 5007 = KCTC 3549]